MTPFFDNRWMIPSLVLTIVAMTGRVRLQAGLKTAFDLPASMAPHGACEFFNYLMYLKLQIEGVVSRGFGAKSLPFLADAVRLCHLPLEQNGSTKP